MSLLYAPIDNRHELLARLYLHAVLPSFEDLLQRSERARAILGDRCFALRMKAGGLVADLLFENGTCHFLKESEVSPAVVLRFLSYRQLINQFTGSGFALPIPIRGMWRMGELRSFITLSDCLSGSLLDDLDVSFIGEDDGKVDCYLQLNFSVALASTAILIEHEGFAQQLFAGLTDWIVSFRVEGASISGWIGCKVGQFSWGRGLPKSITSAELVFRDTRVALEALTGDQDNFAAVNCGAIQINGLAPLADKVGQVMNRVPAYLEV